mgnify:CR=1 FL=1
MQNKIQYSADRKPVAKQQDSNQTTSFGQLSQYSELNKRSRGTLNLMDLPPLGKKAPKNQEKDSELHGLLNVATDQGFGLGGKIITGFRGVASRNGKDSSPHTFYSEVSSMGGFSFKSAFSLSGYTN